MAPRWVLALALVGAGCSGGPPQTVEEAAVVYRAAFQAEPGVSTKVLFPFPVDGAQQEIEQGLAVSDGGTARLEASPEGQGLAVEGRGRVEASFFASRVRGHGGERGVPNAQLSRPVPDGGEGERFLRVNKGGAALVQVEFEYSVSRDCGAACGGKRSWVLSGPVGLSLQQVSMGYSEEKRQ